MIQYNKESPLQWDRELYANYWAGILSIFCGIFLAMSTKIGTGNNIAYDFDVLYQRSERGDTSAIGTLKSGRSVCEGYTNLTVTLLRAAGIPAKKVEYREINMAFSKLQT